MSGIFGTQVRKIKSVFQAKGKTGKHITGTVSYGYLWDEARENWIIDEEAAAVVRRIFSMTMRVLARTK
jgi:hypothetical protein